MERRTAENRALREMVDAVNEFVAVRDEFWSLGLLDKLLRPGRCAAVLTRYETTKARMRAAIGQAKETAGVAARGDRPENAATGQKTAQLQSGGLISMEELEMLLGTPPILKNRFSR